MLKLIKSCHCVGEANVHLQFTPKYRRKIFEDEELRTVCEQLFYGIAERLGVRLAGLGFGPDHVHLFVAGCKNYGAAELARKFKGVSSRLLRKNHWARLKAKELYGDSLWSGGYFYRYVGAVTNETMKKYVQESQSKHWQAHEPTNTQTTLLQFN